MFPFTCFQYKIEDLPNHKSYQIPFKEQQNRTDWQLRPRTQFIQENESDNHLFNNQILADFLKDLWFRIQNSIKMIQDMTGRWEKWEELLQVLQSLNLTEAFIFIL